jgi:hypothetical protein
MRRRFNLLNGTFAFCRMRNVRPLLFISDSRRQAGSREPEHRSARFSVLPWASAHGHAASIETKPNISLDWL